MPLNKCLKCGKRCIGDYCFQHKPRTPMKQTGRLRHEAPKSRQKREQTAKEWHEANPPNEYGQWECYLKISTFCLQWVDEETLNREHVFSKTRRPDLKYDISNIKPACSPCNELKGSRNAKEFT